MMFAKSCIAAGFLVTLWIPFICGAFVNAHSPSQRATPVETISLGDELIPISSPQYTGITPVTHTWVIHALDNKLIEVEFTFFNVQYSENCEIAYLEIYLGNTTSSPLFLHQRFCGNSSYRDFLSQTSDLMFVYWNNNSDTTQGFSAVLSTDERCLSSQFRCGDGTCIQSYMKCDGRADCWDSSDEIQCDYGGQDYTQCGTQTFPPDVSSNPSARIVGGNEAKKGSWPWQVLLTIRLNDGEDNLCGGTIIDEEWIMTAAHCVDRTASNRVTVTAGINDFTSQNDPSELKSTVSVIRVHPSYTNALLGYDIALLRLDNKMVFSQFVRRVCLQQNLFDWNPSDEHDCYATGWGDTVTVPGNPGAALSRNLKQVWLQPRDHAFCDPFYTELLKKQNLVPKDVFSLYKTPDTDLCAGPLPSENSNPNNADTCQGDSGGPLVCFNDDIDAWFQIGITSMGQTPCGSAPGFYASVPELLSWIEQTTDLDFSSSCSSFLSRSWISILVTYAIGASYQWRF